MSSSTSNSSDTFAAAWLLDLLGLESIPTDGQHVTVHGQNFICRDGILRQQALVSEPQRQTGSTFGFKWKKRETFESQHSLDRMHQWLVDRYGDIAGYGWFRDFEDPPFLLDAGCGAGMSGLELFGEVISDIRYIGIDVSEAVEVAASRASARGLPAVFLQADITDLPFAEGTFDIIFSEGVLHHTDSTEEALYHLARLLKSGGRFLFYVYRRKGPVREFTDDYIRDKLQHMTPDAAWDALKPLTELGRVLGELDVEIEIPKTIDLLEIPQGKINLQRLFYWHLFKAFYRPEMTLEEMNHINFDWYAPRNAWRQSPKEIRAWCQNANLVIEREVIEAAGITVIARKE